jgi:hypothetical protein
MLRTVGVGMLWIVSCADAPVAQTEQAETEVVLPAEPARDAAAVGGRPAVEVPASAYTFTQCPDATPPANGVRDSLPACDGSITCGADAHCIPLAQLQMRISEAVLARTPDCSTGKCMPDAFVAAGKLRFQACMGDLGEGRCIPQCFALTVTAFSSIFERGAFGCGSQEVCAPCNNPLTNEPSGACASDMCGG